MEQALHILRMQVHSCSVRLEAGGVSITPMNPWTGKDSIVFEGPVRIKDWDSNTPDQVLDRGSILVYVGEDSAIGGFIEKDESRTHQLTGFFSVSPETFNRMLSVALAKRTKGESAMEIQCPIFQSPLEDTKLELTQLSLTYAK